VLPRAVLYHVNLPEANVTSEQPGKAASLKGAAMPGGTKHEQAAVAGGRAGGVGL
jgi:hypothetical protein